MLNKNIIIMYIVHLDLRNFMFSTNKKSHNNTYSLHFGNQNFEYKITFYN